MARHGINEGDLITPRAGPDKNIYKARSIFPASNGEPYLNAVGRNTTQQSGGYVSAWKKYDPAPDYNAEETVEDL